MSENNENNGPQWQRPNFSTEAEERFRQERERVERLEMVLEQAAETMYSESFLEDVKQRFSLRRSPEAERRHSLLREVNHGISDTKDRLTLDLDRLVEEQTVREWAKSVNSLFTPEERIEEAKGTRFMSALNPAARHAAEFIIIQNVPLLADLEGRIDESELVATFGKALPDIVDMAIKEWSRNIDLIPDIEKRKTAIRNAIDSYPPDFEIVKYAENKLASLVASKTLIHEIRPAP